MRGISLFSFRKRANECLISEKRVFAHFGRRERDKLGEVGDKGVLSILWHSTLKRQECNATEMG